MKASELRIGNLVHHVLLSTSKILELRNDGISICNPKNKQNAYFVPDDKVNRIEPIPITEEWLLKLGYLPWPFAENHFYTKGHVIWNCNGQFLCDKTGVVIKYVHQLQNLYFALTGEELTLKS